MKRKSSQINAAGASPIRPQFPRGLYGERSSKTRFKAKVSGEIQGFGYKERVRFADIIDDDEIQEFDSILLKRNQERRSDDPKTSEYAFFKKLKEDSGHRFQSHSLHQDKNQPMNFKSCENSREKPKNIENSHKDLKSSFFPKDETPDNFVSFLSPLGIASKKSGVDMKSSGTILVDVHSPQENMEEYGVQCKRVDIFTRKRQKLRQLVADTSFPEVDELCSMGYDFVSALLSKLFPDSNEDQSSKFSETGKLEINTKSRTPNSPESDMHFKKSNWMRKRNFMELEYEPSLDIGFSSCWSEIPREREPKRNVMELECGPSLDFCFSSCWSELPGEREPRRNFMELECGPLLDVGFSSYWSEIPKQRELPNPNSPGCRFHRTYFDNGRMKVDYELGERTAPIICTGGDTAFDFHISKHRSLTTGHIKELDNFQHPIEPLHGRKPYALLLGCEFDDMTDRELSLCPILSSSYSKDQLQNLDNRFTPAGLHKPSLFSYCPPKLPSLQFSPPTSNRSHSFEECFLEVKDDILAVIKNFSLSSAHTENHLNLIKSSNCDTKYRDSSILLSSQIHPWNEEQHRSSKEALFSTGVGFYLEPKCIPLPVSHSSRDHYSFTFPAFELPRNEVMSSQFLTGDENANWLDGLSNIEMMTHEGNMVNMHDWSTYYFQKTCPLLLDKSHRNESEGEIYSDDNEVKF